MADASTTWTIILVLIFSGIFPNSLKANMKEPKDSKGSQVQDTLYLDV